MVGETPELGIFMTRIPNDSQPLVDCMQLVDGRNAHATTISRRFEPDILAFIAARSAAATAALPETDFSRAVTFQLCFLGAHARAGTILVSVPGVALPA